MNQLSQKLAKTILHQEFQLCLEDKSHVIMCGRGVRLERAAVGQLLQLGQRLPLGRLAGGQPRQCCLGMINGSKISITGKYYILLKNIYFYPLI